MSQPQRKPSDLLKDISYNAIKDIPEPLTGLPIGKISYKKLARLVYILNSTLFTAKNEYSELEKKYNELLASPPAINSTLFAAENKYAELEKKHNELLASPPPELEDK